MWALESDILSNKEKNNKVFAHKQFLKLLDYLAPGKMAEM